jgi:16S rRNA processing protein RimM
MNNEAYPEVIKLGRPHALSGSIKAIPLFGLMENISELKVIFIGDGPSPLPYFIETIHDDGNQLLIKLEDINDKEKAAQLNGKMARVRQADFDSFFYDEQEAWNDFIGYEAFDTALGALGPIVDMTEMPAHWQAEIKLGEKRLLVPMHEDLIAKILKKKKQITFTLPPGFLDIFAS